MNRARKKGRPAAQDGHPGQGSVVEPELLRASLTFLASPPHRGGGLHTWIWCAVLKLRRAGVSEDEIARLVEAATAGEPLQPNEIADAIVNSRNTAQASGPRVSAWPAVDVRLRAGVIGSHGGLSDLKAGSPTAVEDLDTEEVLDLLFPGDPLLCCGLEASHFNTWPREKWRGQMGKLAFIVPSAMTERHGLTKSGRESARSLANVGPRRFLVIEQDSGNFDEQAAIIQHLAVFGPLALVVHSGGKSLHAWFACRGRDEGRLKKFMCYAVRLGADRATWCPAQMVRMPGGTRENGQRQRVLYFAPEVLK